MQKSALGSELLERVLAAVDVQPAERRYFGLAVQEGGFMVGKPSQISLVADSTACLVFAEMGAP